MVEGLEGDEYSTVLQHHAEDLDREAKLYAPEIYRPRRTVELQILRREYVEYHFAYNAATAHRYNAFYFGDVSDSDDDPVEAEQGWQEALHAIHQRAQATRDTYRSRIHTAARLRTLATLLEPRTLPPPSPHEYYLMNTFGRSVYYECYMNNMVLFNMHSSLY